MQATSTPTLIKKVILEGDFMHSYLTKLLWVLGSGLIAFAWFVLFMQKAAYGFSNQLPINNALEIVQILAQGISLIALGFVIRSWKRP